MSEVKLPEGWIDAQLGQIIDYGKANKKVLSDVKPSTWVLELEDIEKGSSKILNQVEMSERPFKSTKNSFKKGDVLYGKLRPYLNKVIVANRDGVCTTEIIPISAEPLCSNKYIFYWLKNSIFLRYVNDVSYGVNMPRLGTSDGNRAPFRLAPFAEQKIIVDKLDTLLEQVDSAKARLEKISQILKRFRQAVLTVAMSGKLTVEWRKKNMEISVQSLDLINEYWENIYSENGKKRPIAKIQGGTYSNELPKKWLKTRLGNVFDIFVGATPSRAEPEFWSGNIPWVSSSEVAFCKITKTKETITQLGLGNTSTSVHPIGTVMLAMIGQGKTRGQAAILEIEACHNQNTAALRVPAGFALSEYLYYFLVQQYEEIRRIGGGNNQQALNKSFVQSMGFPLPPVEEQTEIVRRVEQLFAYADTIEMQVKNALERVNSLTQSILAKAFRGELTAQWRAENPDLISGENSAQALLEKIQQQRKSIKTIKHRKGNS